MPDADATTELLQRCLDRLKAGDRQARDELLTHACNRLEHLARKMLRGFPNVHRWEQTDDVLQNALVRLWRALEKHSPESVCDFLKLAAAHIRRELIDLARHHYGPEAGGGHHASWARKDFGDSPPPLPDKAESTNEPSRLAEWTELHQQVETLPEEEREVFDLLWYQELSQEEAATLLNISVRTLQRRWRLARLKLHEALKGMPFE